MRRPHRGARRRVARRAAKRALLFALLVLALLGGAEAAWADAPGSAPDPASDGEGTVVYERPPPGPRRGLVSVPAPLVYGAAGLVALAGAAYLVARRRRDR